VTAGTGVDALALFSESGTLLAVTGDMTTAFGTAGFAEGTIANPGSITSYNIVEGTNYYLAFLMDFTGTVVKTSAVTNGQSSNAALNGHYFVRLLASQASMPPSVTPSTMSATSTNPCLYAR
jgi:hypothetical protein